MVSLQLSLHKFDQFLQGQFMRYALRPLLAALLLALWGGYNLLCFRNMTSPEGMDAAQVGRNLAEGRGFTTQFIRPLSVHYVMERNQQRSGALLTAAEADPAMLRSPHPDLANAPVYPVLLAGLMKTLPFNYEINLRSRFWSGPPPPVPPEMLAKAKTEEERNKLFQRRFMRYQPDFIISLFNQALFFAMVFLFYRLAKHLFDVSVARLATVLLIGCELMWKFSMSGLSTHLLLLIFMGLAWGLVLLEQETNEPKRDWRYQFVLAGGIGLLLGLGCLTRYSFGWLLIPTLVCMGLFLPTRRAALCLTVAAVFVVTLAPWMIRNYQICGWPFGTATFASASATFAYPGYRLERSLDPNWPTDYFLRNPVVIIRPYLHKLLNGLREIIQSDLLHLGGGLVGAFFLVGLMLGFQKPSIRRLRYFLTASVGILMFVQSLGRTQISVDVPEVNGENLLVLTYPLVMLFGVSFFYTLLDRLNFIHPLFRHLVVAVFAVLMCLPMIAAFLPPRINPVVYPPYYPPAIRQTAGFMKESELMMSDIPWSVAWYGNRQCIWLTLDAQEQYFRVSDSLKPVRGLYLTPLTMDSRFLTEWVRAGEHSWGSFVLETMLRREIPSSFPLRNAPDGYLPEQFFISDWERWKISGNTNSVSPERTR